MSKADAWMPLHIGPYLADTMHLSTRQHGAYLLLLMHYWRSGPLPIDARKLAGIAKMSASEWTDDGQTVLEFFAIDADGLLHQGRADKEMARAAEISAKRADAGREGKRRQTSGKPLANAGQLPNTCQANAEQLPPHARVAIPLPSPRKEDSEAIASGAEAPQLALGDAPAAPSMRAVLFRDGIPIVRKLLGKSDGQVRALLGKLLGELGDDCAALYAIVREAESLQPANPGAWLNGAVRSRAGPRGGGRQGKGDWLAQEAGLTTQFVDSTVESVQ